MNDNVQQKLSAATILISNPPPLCECYKHHWSSQVVLYFVRLFSDLLGRPLAGEIRRSGDEDDDANDADDVRTSDDTNLLCGCEWLMMTLAMLPSSPTSPFSFSLPPSSSHFRFASAEMPRHQRVFEERERVSCLPQPLVLPLHPPTRTPFVLIISTRRRRQWRRRV